jgi:hypothetical protein
MTRERLTLRKIREILRLKEEAGLSNRAIARACKISNSTVGAHLRRARPPGLPWPFLCDFSEMRTIIRGIDINQPNNQAS